METTKPSRLPIGYLIAGAAMLIGSFMPWYQIKVEQIDKSVDWSGWTRDLFFPLGTLACILAFLVGVLWALETFARTTLPKPPIGLTWKQTRLLVATFGALVMLSYLVNRREGGDVLEYDLGIGYWITLIAALGLMAVAVMDWMGIEERAAAAAARSAHPWSQGAAPPPPAAPPPSATAGEARPVATAAPPAPPAAPAFQPYWFWVDQPADLVAPGEPGHVVGHLDTGAWYLATREDGGWVETDDHEGHRGWLPVAAAHRAN